MSSKYSINCIDQFYWTAIIAVNLGSFVFIVAQKHLREYKKVYSMCYILRQLRS